MQERAERHVERMAGISERVVDHIETMDSPEILKRVDAIDKVDKIARRNLGLRDDYPLGGFSLNVLSLGNLGLEVRSKDQASKHSFPGAINRCNQRRCFRRPLRLTTAA
jgi:hypothetical protein